jgi:prophage regulatory protein
MFMTRFLSKKEVKLLTLYSHTHRARLEDSGKFPKRVRLGNGPRSRVGYVESEITEWIERKLQERDTPDSSQ